MKIEKCSYSSFTYPPLTSPLENCSLILTDPFFSRFSDLDSRSDSNSDSNFRANFRSDTLSSFSKNLSLELEWDRPLLQKDWGQTFAYWDQWQKNENHSLVECLRVKDLGVLSYFLETKNLRWKLAPILDIGGHNLDWILGLLKSTSSLNKRKDVWKKIILSPEVSYSTLRHWREELNRQGFSHVVIEFPLHIPLLLLSTPRFLFPKEGLFKIDSLEGPHKDFLGIQNRQGTLFFHSKAFALWGRWEDWQSLNKDFPQQFCWRLDFRHMKEEVLEKFWPYFFHLLQNPEEDPKQKMKEILGDFTHGYWTKNKTDILFSKLKNKNLPEKNDLFIGEIICTYKKECLIFFKIGPREIKKGQKIRFYSPEGKIKEILCPSFWDMTETPLESTSREGLYFFPWIGGMSVGTRIFQIEQES